MTWNLVRITLTCLSCAIMLAGCGKEKKQDDRRSKRDKERTQSPKNGDKYRDKTVFGKDVDAFTEQERKEILECIGQLKALRLMLKGYAGNHESHKFPDSLADLMDANPAANGELFVCPSDKNAVSPKDSNELKAGKCSYHYFGKGLSFNGRGVGTIIMADKETYHSKNGTPYIVVAFADGQTAIAEGSNIEEVAKKVGWKLGIGKESIAQKKAVLALKGRYENAVYNKDLASTPVQAKRFLQNRCLNMARTLKDNYRIDCSAVRYFTFDDIVPNTMLPLSADVPDLVKNAIIVDELVNTISLSDVSSVEEFKRNGKSRVLVPKGDLYKYLPFTIRMTGDYSSIKRFVQNLHDSKYLFNVRRILIDSSDATDAVLELDEKTHKAFSSRRKVLDLGSARDDGKNVKTFESSQIDTASKEKISVVFEIDYVEISE